MYINGLGITKSYNHSLGSVGIFKVLIYGGKYVLLLSKKGAILV